jgi:hypothetical protein
MEFCVAKIQSHPIVVRHRSECRAFERGGFSVFQPLPCVPQSNDGISGRHLIGAGGPILDAGDSYTAWHPVTQHPAHFETKKPSNEKWWRPNRVSVITVFNPRSEMSQILSRSPIPNGLKRSLSVRDPNSLDLLDAIIDCFEAELSELVRSSRINLAHLAVSSTEYFGRRHNRQIMDSALGRWQPRSLPLRSGQERVQRRRPSPSLVFQGLAELRAPVAAPGRGRG